MALYTSGYHRFHNVESTHTILEYTSLLKQLVHLRTYTPMTNSIKKKEHTSSL